MSKRAVMRVAVLMALTFASCAAWGQEGTIVEVADLEGRASVELRYKLNNQWVFGLEEQLRLKNDISEVDEYFTQFNLKFIPLSNISFAGGLRFIRQNDTQGNIQGYESDRRFHISTTFGHKLGRFSLRYRLRYQNRWESGSDGSEDSDRHVRLRASAGYNIRNWKLDPLISVELYRQVGNELSNEFDNLRFTLGTGWKMGGLGKLGFFYHLDEELGVDYPKTTHIVVFSYVYTFERN